MRFEPSLQIYEKFYFFKSRLAIATGTPLNTSQGTIKMKDWNNFRTDLHARVGDFAKLNPDVMRALSAIDAGVAKSGLLDAKTHELIALAVSVTTRCDGCIATHTKKAVEAGATRGEISEALSVAISLNAGAALTYTARVLDAHDALTAA